MEPQLSQSHVTLVLSSAYTECVARLRTAPIDNSQSASTAPNGAPPNNAGLYRGVDLSTR